MRGNLIDVVKRTDKQGSIPACAGEPCSGLSWTTPDSVYPRVCGGTADAVKDDHGWHGLSPRVRGNHRLDHHQHQLHGSIPACAGEPSRLSGAAISTSVYPRVCGGTPDVGDTLSYTLGLSPRVRGNLLLHQYD